MPARLANGRVRGGYKLLTSFGRLVITLLSKNIFQPRKISVVEGGKRGKFIEEKKWLC